MTSSKSRPSPAKATGKDAAKKGVRKADDVNIALRRAYESAVDETIPQSMMDLLNKLN